MCRRKRKGNFFGTPKWPIAQTVMGKWEMGLVWKEVGGQSCVRLLRLWCECVCVHVCARVEVSELRKVYYDRAPPPNGRKPHCDPSTAIANDDASALALYILVSGTRSAAETLPDGSTAAATLILSTTSPPWAWAFWDSATAGEAARRRRHGNLSTPLP